MDIKDLITVGDLSKELSVSPQTAKAMVGDLPVALSVGRTHLYFRSQVRDVVRQRNQTVLNFLGVRPETESYDTVITDAAPASENQE